MTAWGSVELAVEAMRRGARDFIQKPWENERLPDHRAHADRTEQRLAPGSAAGSGKPRCFAAEGVRTLIAEAPSMQPVLQLISRVGPRTRTF